MNLNNKTIIITGSTSGLGLALARGFLALGAHPIISSADPVETQQIATELNTPGYPADVTSPTALDTLAHFAVDTCGTLDLWINNAGIWLPHDSLENFAPEKLKLLLEVNTLGTIYGCQSALRHMKKANSGTILNIISTSALTPRPHSSAYCASKVALTGLTESLAAENSDANLKILAVYPGKMQTNLFNSAQDPDLTDAMSPIFVAEKIITNLKQTTPNPKLIIDTLHAT